MTKVLLVILPLRVTKQAPALHGETLWILQLAVQLKQFEEIFKIRCPLSYDLRSLELNQQLLDLISP